MKNNISLFITKTLICSIITLSILILNKENNTIINKYILSDTFNFMEFNSWYSKLLNKKENNTTLVSNELFNYLSKENIDNGTKYIFNEETIINSLNNGIIIYKGNKDNLGNTIIVQGSDGYDIWYTNINNSDLLLYDYIEKNTIIGSSSNYINLIITKDNKYYTYEEYKQI